FILPPRSFHRCMFVDLNSPPDLSWYAARAYVPGKKWGRHHIEQSFGAKVVSVYALHGVDVASRADQGQLVGTGARKVLPNDLTTTLIVTTERISKAVDGFTQ